jgi:hypothetical protein
MQDDSGLAVGDVVELHGLQAAHFNGRRGRLTAWDTSAQRWAVELLGADQPVTDEELLLRAANLQRVGSSRGSNDAESGTEEATSHGATFCGTTGAASRDLDEFTPPRALAAADLDENLITPRTTRDLQGFTLTEVDASSLEATLTNATTKALYEYVRPKSSERLAPVSPTAKATPVESKTSTRRPPDGYGHGYSYGGQNSSENGVVSNSKRNGLGSGGGSGRGLGLTVDLRGGDGGGGRGGRVASPVWEEQAAPDAAKHHALLELGGNGGGGSHASSYEDLLSSVDVDTGTPDDASVFSASLQERTDMTKLSPRSRAKLKQYYAVTTASRFVKDIRSAPGAEPHLSYAAAMSWQAQCHPRIFDDRNAGHKGSRPHSFCFDAFGWHLCRCRNNNTNACACCLKCCGGCGETDEVKRMENRNRLDFLQQSTFDRYGIGISLYFKYLKLMASLYAVLLFLVGAPSALLYYFHNDELSRIISAGQYESFLTATNLAFNQLTLGNLANNGYSCGLGFVNDSATIATSDGAPASSLLLACDEESLISIADVFLGVFDGTCECPAERSVAGASCPGRLSFDGSGESCSGYCYQGTLDVVGTPCCSSTQTDDGRGNVSDLALHYTNSSCRTADVAAYAVFASLCNGNQTCTVPLQTSEAHPISDELTEFVTTTTTPQRPLYHDAGTTNASSVADLLQNFTVCSVEEQAAGAVRLLITYQCNKDSTRWQSGWDALSKDQVRFLCSLLDFLACVAFLAQVVFLKTQEDAAVYLLRTKNLTADDYTVMITNLPKHKCVGAPVVRACVVYVRAFVSVW